MSKAIESKRCQAGHSRKGSGWILYFRPKKDLKDYRRCLNKSSVRVRNEEDYGPPMLYLCAECNRTSLGVKR